MNANVSILLNELKTAVAAEFGVIFNSLYLFGSYARNAESEDSDVDVIIALNRINEAQRFEYYDRISRQILLIELKFKQVVSVKIMSAEKFFNADTLFLESVRPDAIEI